MRLNFFISLVLGLLSFYFPLQSFCAKILRNDWYAVYMLGMKVGHMNTQLEEFEQRGKKIFKTTTAFKMTLRHFSKTVEESSVSWLQEDAKGNLIDFYSRLQGSTENYEIHGKADGLLLKYSKTANGKTEYFTQKLPQDIKYYFQIEKLQQQKGLKPNTSYHYKIFSPEKPWEILTQRVEVKNKTKIPFFNETLELHLIEIQTDNLPGIIEKIYLDDHFNSWQIDMGIMGMIFYRTDPETALKTSINDFSFLSFISPTGIFEDSRTVTQAKLKLSARSGSLPEIPSDKNQNVKRTDTDSVLHIQTQPLPKHSMLLPILKPELKEYLQPSDLIQSNHPEIKALTKKILKKEKDAVQAVKIINHWVYKNITKKNFNVLYDSALDVSRKLEGDCTEHSLLFAALARSAGIPCRIVLGLVYTGGIYGYHQWVEVYLDDWYPVDPTLNQDSADATHIFFAKLSLNSSFSENLNLYLPIIKLMGNLNIEILEPQKPE